MCKLCWASSAVLLAVVLALVYMFVIRGAVEEADDGRTAILLSSGERNLVLAEMRGFLESVQEIIEAVVENDMKAIVKSTHNVGMANAQGVPASLMGKLPLEFKKLGMATHQAFDDLGMEAKDMGDGALVMKKLGKLLQNCTACHASYRLEAEKTGAK